MELLDLEPAPFLSLLASYPDPRLWDPWEWSELAPETHAAIAYFERQLRPNPVIEWLEDLRMPYLSSLPRHKRFKADLARRLMFGDPMPT